MGVDLVAMAEGGLHLEVLRELGPGEAVPSPEAKPPIVKQLRYSHHMVARLLAEGRKNHEICAITGYSPSRISILKNDPAFRDLVEHYAAQVREAYTDIHARLASFGFSCLEEAQERLEQSPGDFSLNQLREWLETVLDRSIAPKKGGPQAALGGNNITINVEFPGEPKGVTIEGVASDKT